MVDLKCSGDEFFFSLNLLQSAAPNSLHQSKTNVDDAAEGTCTMSMRQSGRACSWKQHNPGLCTGTAYTKSADHFHAYSFGVESVGSHPPPAARD